MFRTRRQRRLPENKTHPGWPAGYEPATEQVEARSIFGTPSKLWCFDRKGCDIEWATAIALKLDADYVVVAKQRVQTRHGDLEVSTVWLGVDCAMSDILETSPIYFETMCFGPAAAAIGAKQWRAGGEDEARRLHAAVVAAAISGAVFEPDFEPVFEPDFEPY